MISDITNLLLALGVFNNFRLTINGNNKIIKTILQTEFIQDRYRKPTSIFI